MTEQTYGVVTFRAKSVRLCHFSHLGLFLLAERIKKAVQKFKASIIFIVPHTKHTAVYHFANTGTLRLVTQLRKASNAGLLHHFCAWNTRHRS